MHHFTHIVADVVVVADDVDVDVVYFVFVDDVNCFYCYLQDYPNSV